MNILCIIFITLCKFILLHGMMTAFESGSETDERDLYWIYKVINICKSYDFEEFCKKEVFIFGICCK